MIQFLLLVLGGTSDLGLEVGPQTGQNGTLARDKTVIKFVRVSSRDWRHEEYVAAGKTRPRFALRLHSMVTLIGNRAETGMPSRRFSVIGKGRAQSRSSMSLLLCICHVATGGSAQKPLGQASQQGLWEVSVLCFFSHC